MQPGFQRSFRYFTASAFLLLSTSMALAQEAPTPKKRLRNYAAGRGLIGGEAHDGDVNHARKGRLMTVQISWRRDGANRADFTTSDSPNFYSAGPVELGRE